MRIRPATRAASVALCSLLLLPGVAGARELALEDLFAVREVAEPQLSPDGERVAYSVSRPDRELDEDTSDLWLVTWNGRENLQLTRTPASEHHPRWSPDGRYLAFLADRDGPGRGEQIWLLDMRGGEARPVTWAKTYGEGRVVYTILGHGPDAQRDARVRQLVAQALLWAGGRGG